MQSETNKQLLHCSWSSCGRLPKFNQFFLVYMGTCRHVQGGTCPSLEMMQSVFVH